MSENEDSIPGWYFDPRGELLWWWVGRRWYPAFIKAGRPRVDPFVTEPPMLAWVSGGVLGVLAVSFVAATADVVSFGVLAFLMLALFGSALRGEHVRRRPHPVGVPMAVDAVRPLPGEQEGPTAGWFPVMRGADRWWTGVRWSQYVRTRAGVWPTFHGRLVTISCWICVGFTALCGIDSVVLAAEYALAAEPGDRGVPLLLGSGVLCALLTVGLCVSNLILSRVMLIPQKPPRVRVDPGAAGPVPAGGSIDLPGQGRGESAGR